MPVKCEGCDYMNYALEREYWRQFDVNNWSMIDKLIEFYENIIELNKSRELEVCEMHHMIPKSFDTYESKLTSNLLKMSPREHYEVHKILTKCFNGEYKKRMIYALHRMSICRNKNYRISSSDKYYEKKVFRKLISIQMSGKNNPMYGRRVSNESIDIAREKHTGGSFYNNGKYIVYLKDNNDIQYYESIGYIKGRGISSLKNKVCINNGVNHKYVNQDEIDKYLNEGWKLGYTDKRVRDHSDKLIGKKHTDEHKRKISDSITGEKNPFYGRKHSEESRKKMSENSKGNIVWQKLILVVSDNSEEVMKARDVTIKYNIYYDKIREVIDTGSVINNVKLYSLKKES